jgi:5-methylcytosine-specific restriction endonuclease McrA
MTPETKKWNHLYNRAIWRGPNGVRLAKLRRDPICEVLGCTRPAAHVDHIVKHNGNWILFIGGVATKDNPFPNLRSLCAAHHDAKPEWAEKPGAREFNPVAVTGEDGRQFQSAVSVEQINKALPTREELDDLLKGIPE